MKIDNYTKLNPIGITRKALLDSYLSNYRGVRLIRLDNNSTSDMLQLRTYFLVKSKTSDKIEYCIVFDITSDKDKVDGKSDIKIMSNEPNFTFRFAFVYGKHDMLIKDLRETFLNKLAYTKKPKIRNPYEMLVMNEKIFHCIHFISKNKIKFHSKASEFGQGYKPLNTDQMVILVANEKKRKRK